MYTCGPTVYDYAHVGNFRAFLTYDLLKRTLMYLGYNVLHVCNLTDIDDKIIARANELQLDHVSQLTRHYEHLFRRDVAALHIIPASFYPRATDHIAEMMAMIQQLHTKGLAYETTDGSWYFRTRAWPGYGQQLVQLSDEDDGSTATSTTMDMSRPLNDNSEANEIPKEHSADFCLWKAFKVGVDRDDAAWSSQDVAAWNSNNNNVSDSSVVIQKGRPGWHLECSAMALKFFGHETTIDLHGGGVDLKFPHHENEIAQAEGVTGQTFCNCWFHNGFVNLGSGEKMSKSLGNFVTLRTACPTGDDVRAYRYLVVSSQYRNPLAFTPECMSAAKSAIKRMDKCMADLLQSLPTREEEMNFSASDVPMALDSFEAAILDDLSMPRAAAALFTLIKAAEQEFKRAAKDDSFPLDTVGLKAIQLAIQKMDQVFGIFYEVPVSAEESKDLATRDEESATIPGEVLDLVSKRTAAKEAKDWELADSLRKRITELGFAIKDSKDGQPIISRVES
jgi:cysteinyl-tRNA synthetase